MQIRSTIFVCLMAFGPLCFAQEVAPPLSSPTPEPTPSPTPAPAVALSESVAEWQPKLNWAMDLRYRAAKARESVDEERTYQQLRARLGLKADVNKSIQGVVRLATGTSAISTNQTLGDPKDPGMPRRNFGIDLAYIDATFLESGKFWIGRTANPFWAPGKTSLVFDPDLAFEGMALKWEPSWSKSSAFINLGATIISENYTAPSDVVDTGLVGAQAGYSLKAFGTWTAHVSTQQYLNIQGMPITVVDKDAKTDPYSYPFDKYRGNTVVPNDPLLPPDSRKYFFQNGYILMEAGLEWKQKFGPVDVTLFYDEVFNDLTTDSHYANEYGIGIKWKDLQVGFAHALKQSDAVVGAFTDSDMNGGGTDNKGTRISVAYQFRKNAQIAVTDFRAKRGIDSVERDYSATQFDLIVAY